MTTTSRSRTGKLLGALTAGALVVPALLGARATAEQPGAADAKPNDAREFLQVYDANVENLPTPDESSPAECAGDWHDLLYYMRTQELKPDLYLVQQLNNQDQLDLLLKRMETHFGEKYAGVLAEPNPDATTGGACNTYKKRQTNAVIWRTDRLSLVKSQAPGNRWRAQAEDGTDCVNSTQPRTMAVKALLHDRVSGRTVTAASFHWPTMDKGEGCARSNIGELSNELTEDGYDTDPTHGATDLYVAGGDTNAHDLGEGGAPDGEASPWYAAANGDLNGSLGFRDAVWAGCATTADPLACRTSKWTFQGKTKRRIDYVLGRGAGGEPPRITNAVVPTFQDGNDADDALSEDGDNPLGYSDHHAVGARVHY